ncbi:MAG: rRNA maturation RNase YbeY [bacterium]
MTASIIDIADRATRPHPFVKRAIRPLLLHVGTLVWPGQAIELSVSLVSDRAMRALNAKHRHKDKTTDVLSFPLEHDLRPRLAATTPEVVAIGDIVISPPVCLKQATEWGWTPGERLTQLLIHGYLHLLGFDHEEEAERAMMEAREEELFEACGVAGLIGPLTES